MIYTTKGLTLTNACLYLLSEVVLMVFAIRIVSFVTYRSDVKLRISGE